MRPLNGGTGVVAIFFLSMLEPWLGAVCALACTACVAVHAPMP